MKHVLSIVVCLFASASVLISAEREKSDAKPDAGGIVIEPSEGEIAPGSELTITFPNAIVNADKIDIGGQPSPVVSAPKIEGDFCGKARPRAC